MDQLEKEVQQWRNLTIDQANNYLKPYADESCMRIKTKAKIIACGDQCRVKAVFGQSLVDYDMNFNLVNGVFYSPDDFSMEVEADIIIVVNFGGGFIDGGAY